MQELEMSEGACYQYKENDACKETLSKFRTALQANRSGAASAWKSAVKLLKLASSRRPESYCFRSCPGQFGLERLLFVFSGASADTGWACGLNG